mmetsp:Transcript_13544/g.49279  ORF Transcript_13544/g.49279 Transcript_13544/m.49279 type:complete len:235 (-) Transcript_13544:70-774(-)|eukprot:scaffold1941_cov377-Prasinococcus_capsulatus_cf.AAC.10
MVVAAVRRAPCAGAVLGLRSRAPGRRGAPCRAVVRAQQVSLSIPKPLGLVLEEGAQGAIVVAEIVESGNAAADGSVKVGDRVLQVDGTNTEGSSFDAVMDLLANAQDEVSITLERPAKKAPPPPKGTITLTIRGKEGEKTTTVPSGDEILRNVILEEGVPLYQGMDSFMNCGGIGNCGTCVVNVIEGAGLLSDRSDAETRKLRNKPDTYRLACQCIVGDDTNSGDVVVETLPGK